MIKVDTRKFEEKIRYRIRALPSIINDTMQGQRKRDAIRLIDNFRKGIAAREFGLIALKGGTIARKKSMGYKLPDVPLYGKGMEIELKSYLNMLRIRRLKKGWKVFQSWGKHHKAQKMELRRLFKIHEYGAIIKTKSGSIRIPPRPAIRKAYNKTMAEIAKREPEFRKRMKKEIKRFVQDGQRSWFDQMKENVKKGRKYEQD